MDNNSKRKFLHSMLNGKEIGPDNKNLLNELHQISQEFELGFNFHTERVSNLVLVGIEIDNEFCLLSHEPSNQNSAESIICFSKIIPANVYSRIIQLCLTLNMLLIKIGVKMSDGEKQNAYNNIKLKTG